MWGSHFKIAWRQIRKKPQLSVIKILGLGLGIAASILLIKYITWQWNFDKFHEDSKNIVRIQNDHYRDGVLSNRSAMTYSGVPLVAKQNFPVVIDYVRLGRWIANDVVFRFEENMFRGKECFFADPTFFDIFSFELLQGDPKTALLEPNSLVLTVSTAKTLFGNENPMGKEVLFENFKTFYVTGVVKDPPIQSHIQFDILGSLSTMTNWGLDVYGNEQLNFAYVYAYLQLQENTNQEILTESLNHEITRLKSQDAETDVFTLQQLERIHLYSDLDHEISSTGQGNNIWILSSIAILILILGWVNHFNLFSAEAIEKSNDLSIRKIVGAGRAHLFTQLLVAASLSNVLGLVVGMILADFIESFIARSFQIPFDEITLLQLNFSDPASYILLLLIIGAIFSCLLPASVLSMVKPVYLFHHKNTLLPSGFTFRKALVTFQFTIIIGLLVCTGVIYQQTRYMQNKDLGMNLENVIPIRGPLGMNFEILESNLAQFEQEISKVPGITGMSVSHNIPGNQLGIIENLKLEDKNYSNSFYRNYGNLDYFTIYQIPFVVSDTAIFPLVKDKRYAILNQMASELLGFKTPEGALHKKLKLSGWEIEIVGVVENYHQRSLHHSMIPIIYDLSSDNLMTDGYYSFKVEKSADHSMLTALIRKAYQKSFPYTVFDPIDFKAYFEAQYQSDNHFKRLNLGFTLLGLIIACMGILGLAMIALNKRIKEISIRKVLGANSIAILFLLTRDYLKLIGIAILIASPVAYYLMSQWLQNFNYRIHIPWWIFIAAGVVAFSLAFLTIGYQSFRAAMVNPVDSLRQE